MAQEMHGSGDVQHTGNVGVQRDRDMLLRLGPPQGDLYRGILSLPLRQGPSNSSGNRNRQRSLSGVRTKLVAQPTSASVDCQFSLGANVRFQLWPDNATSRREANLNLVLRCQVPGARYEKPRPPCGAGVQVSGRLAIALSSRLGNRERGPDFRDLWSRPCLRRNA